MIVVTCSCGRSFRTNASRRIITACVCVRCRAPLVNARIEDA